MEEENKIDDILAMLDEDFDLEPVKIKKETTFSKIKNIDFKFFKEWFVFWLKYLATTTLIFAVLLWITNYSAYYQIADSHLNKEKYQNISNSLRSSVIDSNITKINIKEERTEISTNLKENEKEEIIKTIKETEFHSMTKLENLTSDNVDLDISVVPFENRLIIPNIWKNIPLIEVKDRKVKNAKELEDVFMDELEFWVVRYPGSSMPWKDWNTFIFWHSSNFPWAKWKYNDVFAKLDSLQYWNKIYIYYWQKKYTYKVKTKKVINPRDVDVITNDSWKSELTLMTCFPIWTTLNRLIVVAELIEVE